ncbi:hypothetical protein [Acidiferrobacter sp.]|uniref:hypothetical protein n=1 Tax=Acidiferrobacter sp. TaxID=1872107 RepID=UPI002628DF8B|nr:hypothetical protein [Acidiferrobacter sp.]
MSNLEDKLSASLQTQRRRPGTKPAEAERPAAPDAGGKGMATPADEADLNAGGGRGVNPPRVWPD